MFPFQPRLLRGIASPKREARDSSSQFTFSGETLPLPLRKTPGEGKNGENHKLQSGQCSPAKHGDALFLGCLWVYERSDCCSRTVWESRMLVISWRQLFEEEPKKNPFYLCSVSNGLASGWCRKIHHFVGSLRTLLSDNQSRMTYLLSK